MTRSLLAALLAPTLALTLAGSTRADDPTYWQDIRPLLRKHCTVCHNVRRLAEPEVSAGLALDSLEAIRKGGQVGVLVPGKAQESLLVRILSDPNPARRMPLDADPLPAEVIAVFRKWVDAGAPEGKPTAEAVAAPTPKRPAPTRRLPVVLPTRLLAPAQLLPGLKQPAKTDLLDLLLPVGPLPPVTAVAFSPDGQHLAVGTYGQVVIWDVAQVRPSKVLTNVLGAVNDLRFSPDGKLLAVAGGQPSARGEVRLLATADWKLLHTLGGHTDTVAAVAFAPDASELVSVGFDRSVKVWQTATGKARLTLNDHSDFVHAVAYAASGDYFVTASKDRTVRLRDAKTGRPKLTFSGMDDDVLAVAVTADGKQVVSSGMESQLHWWDAQTGQRTRKIAGHTQAVNELASSAGYVVSAGADRTVRIWDSAEGKALRTLPVGSMVYAVAIRPGEKQLACGSFDGTVRLYDLADGRHLLTLLALPADQPSRADPAKATDPAAGADWLALTPEGYYAHSHGLAEQVGWRLRGQALPAEKLAALHQPAQVQRAAQGQPVPEPTFDR